MTDNHYPSNQIHVVGFPEGQLLGNGATPEQCGEISAAFLQGESLPKTGNEQVDRVSDLLTNHPSYGICKGDKNA